MHPRLDKLWFAAGVRMCLDKRGIRGDDFEI